MSERKVLNKYYPPDFDPAKIPRMKLAKNRQYTVRLMAPFNMRCVTCGEYIYKGKKFNARKEDVEDQTYLGIRIYRFYIKCTRCLQEISFKTDPRNTDYEIEAGATRNFMALKLAEEQAKKEEEELREEEASNPMKLLENRTQQSRNEIELLESLEELKDLNRRQQSVDYDTMLRQYNVETEREREERLEKLDEEYIKSVKFEKHKNSANANKRIAEIEIVEEIQDCKQKITEAQQMPPPWMPPKQQQQSKIPPSPSKQEQQQYQLFNNKSDLHQQHKEKSVGGFSNKNILKNLVKKKSNETETTTTTTAAAQSTLKDDISTIDVQKNNDNNKNSKNTNALTLLSGYDDDDDSDDSNTSD